MKDKDGKELKPGDRVKVEFESVVPDHDGMTPARKAWIVEPLRDHCWLEVNPSFLTKIVPEFEWTHERDPDDGNSTWTLMHGRIEAAFVRTVLMHDLVVFQTNFNAHPPFDTLEAAKAAAEAAVKGGGT